MITTKKTSKERKDHSQLVCVHKSSNRLNSQNTIKQPQMTDENRPKAVATIILTTVDDADEILANFVPNLEVRQLLAIPPSKLFDKRFVRRMVDPVIIQDAKKINPDVKIQYDYVMKYLTGSERKTLSKLDDTYRYILRVEPPKRYWCDYINIDIGPTSNGKPKKNESLVATAIRETKQEAHVCLKTNDICFIDKYMQTKIREELKLTHIPYIIDIADIAELYIVILHKVGLTAGINSVENMDSRHSKIKSI